MARTIVLPEQLLRLARKGRWQAVDECLAKRVSVRILGWALAQPRMANSATDRVAARVLMASSTALSPAQLRHLEKWMAQTTLGDVQHRLAVVLYERNYRTPAVREMYASALADSDLGAIAQEHYQFKAA